MSTFEENFPSLTNHCRKFMLSSENNFDEELTEAKISTFCLDKQRVQDAIEKIKSSCEKAYGWRAMEELEKELGL